MVEKVYLDPTILRQSGHEGREMIGSNKERGIPAGRIEQQGEIDASDLIAKMSVNPLAHSNCYCVRARGDESGLWCFCAM